MWNRTRAALYLVCISRAGYRDGGRLIQFIEDWRRCVEIEGAQLSIEDFVRLTRRYSSRTAYSRLELFRRVFPQLGPLGLPQQLMGPLIERLAAEVEDVPPEVYAPWGNTT